MKNLTVQKWIFKAAKKDGLIILLLAVISGVISLCTVWFALISRSVVDIATGAAGGSMWRESAKLIGVLVFQALLNIVQSRLNIQVVGQMEIRINQMLFSRLFDKKWSDVSRYHSGDVLNRMTSDVSVVVNAVVSLGFYGNKAGGMYRRSSDCRCHLYVDSAGRWAAGICVQPHLRHQDEEAASRMSGNRRENPLFHSGKR